MKLGLYRDRWMTLRPWVRGVLGLVGLAVVLSPAFWSVIMLDLFMGGGVPDILETLAMFLGIAALAALAVASGIWLVGQRRVARLWGGWPLGAVLGFLAIGPVFGLYRGLEGTFSDPIEALAFARDMGIGIGMPMGGTVASVIYLIRRQRRPEDFGETARLTTGLIGFHIGRIVALNLFSFWALGVLFPR